MSFSPTSMNRLDAGSITSGRYLRAQPVLERAPIFAGVESSVVAELSRQLRLHEFRAGQTIYSEGEPGDRLYIVITGKVKIGRRCSDGRENLLAIMSETDIFGALSVFDAGPRTATATAVTDVCVATMDRDALWEWIRGRPQISEQLLRVLARRLRRTDEHVIDMLFVDVPGRIAKELLRLAQRFGRYDDQFLRVTHDLTQGEIAQLVGASRETVNKTLSDFANRGWIRLDGKSAVILEPERLAHRAAR
jgi:CRP/FNR family cyclic AMP-dependent transcriptional regulator